MKTSIIILTYNKLEYTVKCVESIRKYTNKEDYEIIIVDNNSVDGTIDWLQEQADIITILNKDNLGFPGGCNAGIKIATGSEILLLNNDTIVTKNWLSNLLKALYSDEKVGAVSCVTNNCSYGQEIPVDYASIEEMHRFAKKHNIFDSNLWDERLKLVGFCMLIKKQVINELGLLDEMFFPGNFEDDDYSLRIRKAGYKLLLCKDTFIHHYGSVSFKEELLKYKNLMITNAKKYENKWGFNPLYSQNLRREIINFIQEPLDKELNILDIGCACGGALLEIKNKYKQSNLYGIELNEYAAEVAALICEVYSINIENNDLPFNDEFFDYIILADVLEHLVNPWTIVNKLKRILKKDGKLLISVPNVMHVSVMRNLIAKGEWKYEDAGIMDRTHLRFFTYQSIQDMLNEQGYSNIVIEGTTINLSEEEELFYQQLTQICPQHIIQQYKIYQYIISASNDDLNDFLQFVIDNQDNGEKIWKSAMNYSTEDIINLSKRNRFTIEERVKFLNSLAVINFEHGMIKNVIPFFEEARELDEKNSEVLYNLSYFLQYVGETELAQEYMLLLKKLDLGLYKQLVEVIC
ncbi:MULTISPECIES: glycosyltransferase [Paenibacillus]|uniref:glycosyltransferase n=1 Tax=Paenibacillus TaxID=44249 RepID=UPI00096C0B73|nr:glycosyltransferase [Paenibacillus odorifer]OME61881.1 hypothetical protein BSK61_02135 [Paenibacillus odorifer]